MVSDATDADGAGANETTGLEDSISAEDTRLARLENVSQK